MTDDRDLVLPRPGQYAPAVVEVRLIGPPDAVAAARKLLADLCGPAWQPSARKASRHEGGGQVQYGTLIVPVPDGTDLTEGGTHATTPPRHRPRH